jgi:hypothetical protein
MSKMSETENLLRLYELTINEQQHHSRGMQTRIAFFSGLLSALLAATITGIFQATAWYHLVLLLAGPIVLHLMADIGIEGNTRLYQLWLESITVRAKLEQKLGLTATVTSTDSYDDPDIYWRGEPLIPSRHIDDRNLFETSDAFIRHHISKRVWQLRFFRTFKALSIALGLGLAFLVFLRFVGMI